MALKIVYQTCCGIDVHKTFVVACIATTNKQGVTTYKRHRFSTFTQGLRELLQWLLDNNCKDVCMESTGKYWIPVYNVLENDCTIVLAHPKYVKAIRGKKTDKKDAKWIADLFIKNKEPYNAELYRKSDVLPVNREITVEQAIIMAQFQGYKIKSATE